ncbi:hypothetical protein ACLOJK_027488, partial [Asimina triloba]
GKISVKEYDIKCKSLIRFVPQARADTHEAAIKFQEGLKLNIKKHMTTFRFQRYSDIKNLACVVEREEEDKNKQGERGKGLNPYAKKQRLYTCIPASPPDSSGIITILERPSPHVSSIASLMTRQVIHPILGVTLDDIRINTLLERPSPHVSPIASLMTRQVIHPIPDVTLDDIRINTVSEIS